MPSVDQPLRSLLKAGLPTRLVLQADGLGEGEATTEEEEEMIEADDDRTIEEDEDGTGEEEDEGMLDDEEGAIDDDDVLLGRHAEAAV